MQVSFVRGKQTMSVKTDLDEPPQEWDFLQRRFDCQLFPSTMSKPRGVQSEKLAIILEKLVPLMGKRFNRDFWQKMPKSAGSEDLLGSIS